MQYTIAKTFSGLTSDDALTGTSLGELIDSSTDLRTDGIHSIAEEDRLVGGQDDFEWKWQPERSCHSDEGYYRLTLRFQEHLGSPARKMTRFVHAKED